MVTTVVMVTATELNCHASVAVSRRIVVIAICISSSHYVDISLTDLVDPHHTIPLILYNNELLYYTNISWLLYLLRILQKSYFLQILISIKATCNKILSFCVIHINWWVWCDMAPKWPSRSVVQHQIWFRLKLFAYYGLNILVWIYMPLNLLWAGTSY